MKEKTKVRKNLLAEKKETPFYQIPKLRDLTRRIAWTVPMIPAFFL